MSGSEGRPASVADALGMLDRALGYLATADTAALPTSAQADTLLALAKAEARHTAAHARVLAAFAAQGGYEDDGHGSARTWLRWRARVTPGAAAGAVGWMRRLTAHPVIAEALAAGALSESWARQICEWSDRLPEALRGGADEILAAAALGGADFSGLAGLAQQMYERGHPGEPDEIFDDRYLRLGITFRGAGRTEGDLTPGCAAALDAVLESLGRKAGPEDTRTAGQRRHDALEEACTRLITSGMIPGGQPARAHLHITLAELRGAPGASQAEDAWAAARAAQPGWLAGAEAQATGCDATLVPIVTGHVDWLALDRFTEAYLATRGLTGASPSLTEASPSLTEASPDPKGANPRPTGADTSLIGANPGPAGASPGPTEASPNLTRASPDPTGPNPSLTRASPGPTGANPSLPGPEGGQPEPARGQPDLTAANPSLTRASPGPTGPGTDVARAKRCHRGDGRCGGCTCGGCACPEQRPLSPETLQRLRATMLRLAADVLSGPDGLASWLRRSHLGGGPGGGPSLPLGVPLPLDTGEAGLSVPAHLRRAATTRHIHCAFPGCRVPAAACHIHHLVPRARDGPTAIGNLVPLCGFHHLTAVHRWGWALTLHADGSVTATSPNRARTLHDHGPPARNSPSAGHDPLADHDPPAREGPPAGPPSQRRAPPCRATSAA